FLFRLIYGRGEPLYSYERTIIAAVEEKLSPSTVKKLEAQLANLPFRQRSVENTVLSFFPARNERNALPEDLLFRCAGGGFLLAEVVLEGVLAGRETLV